MDPAEILPPELMSRIFALAIGSYHDLHSILHVSRAWYQLARHNPIVWKTLARRWFPFFDWRRSHLIHESDWRPRAWNELYKFGDLESDQSSTTYRDALQQVLDGQRWCFAQVFDRSMFTNAGGTQLSAYDAVIRRIPNREIEQRPELRSTWAAYYMGASTAEPDSKCFFNHEVDIVHQRRLRAIPKQVRAVYDPFKAYFLEPLESLAVDMEIELQFRFSPTKPFGMRASVPAGVPGHPTAQAKNLILGARLRLVARYHQCHRHSTDRRVSIRSRRPSRHTSGTAAVPSAPITAAVLGPRAHHVLSPHHEGRGSRRMAAWWPAHTDSGRGARVVVPATARVASARQAERDTATTPRDRGSSRVRRAGAVRGHHQGVGRGASHASASAFLVLERERERERERENGWY